MNPQLIDKIFKTKVMTPARFQFDERVAEVFDDMVARSVPFYREIHSLLLDLLDRHYGGGLIYDLGCSTGTSILLIDHHFGQKKSVGEGLLDVSNLLPKIVGVDSSPAMLKMAQKKLKQTANINYHLRCEDLTKMKFEPASFIFMNYTLQFIPPAARQELIQRIYDSLEPGGVFLLTEKILGSSSVIESLITDLYYDFKRANGYSELEISQKREALEQVMKPSAPEEHIRGLESAGFNHREMIFRWYNFASFVGIKS